MRTCTCRLNTDCRALFSRQHATKMKHQRATAWSPSINHKLTPTTNVFGGVHFMFGIRSYFCMKINTNISTSTERKITEWPNHTHTSHSIPINTTPVSIILHAAAVFCYRCLSDEFKTKSCSLSEFTATLWYFLLITHDCVFPQDSCTTGLEPREGNVTVIVQVIDTDDEPPAFSQDNYDVTIPERDSTFVYTSLSASDGDSFNTPLRYSFIGEYIPSHQHNWTLTQKYKKQQQ